MGSVTETWTDAFDVHAAFGPLGSTEFPSAAKRHAEATARFRIRYRHGIAAGTHRIVFAFDPNESPTDFRTFDIFQPMPVDGKRFELWIEAVEVI